MATHLIKMCVGCESIDHLKEYQATRLADSATLTHRTKNMPRQADDILAGGSLYWVIKGEIKVRQRITALTADIDEHGKRYCFIQLDPNLTCLMPGRWFRPFQGWRYLTEADAPPDLDLAAKEERDQMPVRLVKELKELGLL